MQKKRHFYANFDCSRNIIRIERRFFDGVNHDARFFGELKQNINTRSVLAKYILFSYNKLNLLYIPI